MRRLLYTPRLKTSSRCISNRIKTSNLKRECRLARQEPEESLVQYQVCLGACSDIGKKIWGANYSVIYFKYSETLGFKKTKTWRWWLRGFARYLWNESKVEAKLEKLLKKGFMDFTGVRSSKAQESRWDPTLCRHETGKLGWETWTPFDAMNGSNVVSKLDLRSGYHQVELHPESRYITTFATHRGLFQYNRLSFGISSASECFQTTVIELTGGVKKTWKINDDILAYGRSLEEYDRALKEVLNRISEGGLTLNASKCEFRER